MIYIMSDIHGCYYAFEKMLDKIAFSDTDTLYINGDVIDRGTMPITTLKKVMTTSNIIMLAGNHEDMMLKSMKDASNYASWYMNGSTNTEREFYSLSFPEQFQVLDFLQHCPVIIPQLKVNNKLYYIAHASHLPFYMQYPLLYPDLTKEQRHQVLWSREYKNPDASLVDKYHDLYSRYKNTTFICGHNVVPKCSYGITDKNGAGRISRSASGHLINTDCGCYATGVLGCLRLDDMQEFYTRNHT